MPDPIPKPATYDYEFYENTFNNDPSGVLTTDQPLLSFAVGDYIHDEIGTHFSLDKPKDHVFQIIGVWHIISDFRSDRTHHRLAVCVRAVPKPDIFR